MTVLAQTASYALDAVVYIAGHAGAPVRVHQIAAALEVPRNYLSKTLHLLAREGVLESTRGRRGGFGLAIPAERLTLAQVVAPFEAVGRAGCLLGRPRCLDRDPCAAHHQWKAVAARVDRFFSQTTVADLVRHPPAARRAAG